MSASDAAELELRVVGGETGLRCRTAGRAARAEQDETLGRRFQQENHRGDEKPAGQDRYPSAIRQEGTHRALNPGTDRRQKDAHCGDPQVQIQKPTGPRFTSCLFLRFSSNPRLGKPELNPTTEPDSCSHSLTEPVRPGTEDSSPQVIRRTSRETSSTCSKSEKKKETGSTLCQELQTVSKSPSFSNDDLGPYECNGLHILSGSGSGSVQLNKDIKDHSNPENPKDPEKLSNLSRTMLSSSVVTALAPHWSGRRRNKRLEGTGFSDAQGNLEDVKSTAVNCAHESFQAQKPHREEKVLTQEQLMGSLIGCRRTAVGWSTNSGPASLGCESKRKMIQVVSLNVNPGVINASALPALSLNPKEESGHKAGVSPLSSKPTTSSVLLSLRRVNHSGRSSNAASTLSGSSALSNLPSERDEKSFTTHFSPPFLSNKEQERPKPLHISSSTFYRTPEPGPLQSSSSSPSNRDRNISGTCLFSFPATKKDGEDTLFTQQPQPISRTQSSLSLICSKPSLLSEGPSQSPNLLSENSGPSPRHPSVLLKTHSLPRRTTLTSTSWWKQVTQEDSDTATDKEEPNSPLILLCNDGTDFTSPSTTDHKKLSSQMSQTRENTNTTESVCQSDTHLGVNTQRETRSLEHRNDHKSDISVDQQHGYSLNSTEPQQPLSLASVSCSSNISRAQTLSHPKDLSKSDNHGSSETTNIPASPHNVCEAFSPAAAITHNSKALSSKTTPGFCPPSTSSIFSSHPGSSQANNTSPVNAFSPQTTKVTNSASATPLGFQRSQPSLPKPSHPKRLSSQIPTLRSFSKTKYSPVSAVSLPSSILNPPAAPGPSPLTPPVTPVITSSPINISSILTPPATPVNTSRSFLETSSSQGGSAESDPKKLRTEGNRVRRVKWDESVDLQHYEPVTLEKEDSSQVPVGHQTLSGSPRSIKAPAIFSFLRSSSPAPKSANTQVRKAEKYRSLSSDSAAVTSREQKRPKLSPRDIRVSDQGACDLIRPGQEGTQSLESGTVQYKSSGPLSLPPEFSAGSKFRYSTTPYSTLISSRSTQGESKSKVIRSPLFQPYLSSSNPPLVHVSPTQPSFPFQNTTAMKESSHNGAAETNEVTNNHSKILLVDNRVHISSETLQADKSHSSSSTCITETLIYSIKPKADPAATKSTTPTPAQHSPNTLASMETKLSKQSHTVHNKEAAHKPHSHSDQSCSGSSSTETQSQDGEDGSRRPKTSVLGRSRLFSTEASCVQSPKRSRFALKKSVSTTDSSLSRSDSEKSSKNNNKMDQVLNRLRQTFSNRWPDDDLPFPWKWKRTSQTPSVSGSSDVSDVTVDSTKTLEKPEEGRGVVLEDRGSEGPERLTQSRYTITPPSSAGRAVPRDELSVWPDESAPEEQNKTQVHLRVHSPTNQFFSSRDPNFGSSQNLSGCYPAKLRNSASSPRSPRSPFSPFSSISPPSQCPSPDVTDDSVFYSPKLRCRRESSSPCEPGERLRLRGSRSRASTGTHSADPEQDSASSYADLKYGIEPGRSFSVSSVLSSRPSGPGRISTGSRFMSVGDLSKSALTCGGTAKDLDQWSFVPVWSTEKDCQPTGDCSTSYSPSDPGKMRSRSLPRSLTKCLANWSSGVPASHSGTTTTSKPVCLFSPSMNSSHFAWDTDSPPTPPPTPPLSPVTRRMSKPASFSSPTFSGLSEASQPVDTQSSRGHLPSRGYVSSLSTFEESSDSSSDTTTDDEYYLETGEDEEKETEL
ncbi:mucin-5AC-like isoform X2 [Mastacembelus armatus]|uniref:mucin-5AC-like isoform X2 n=1 Tax=Mastacembelus armatus TaxID=205130 RepID=UPI000E462422|nr:mucin-5AC-like isoform X2 [Mastacembelus armatus]